MQRALGFTIVEVIIVVIVIGILASLGIFLFSQTQMNVRNDERSADVTAVADALEEYYRANSVYPSCTTMTQSASTVASTLGIDKNLLRAPSAALDTNSVTCGALTSGSGPDTYGYVVDNGASCVAGTYCFEYTLQYRQEGTNAIISKKSLRCGSTGYGTCQRPGV